MIYSNIKEARFLKRVNRFVALCEIEGKQEKVHIKNTGRLQELLIPNAPCYVQEFDKTMRKTKFDLISVYKEEKLVNVDSQVCNTVVKEALESQLLFTDISLIQAEKTFQNSRFDFYIEYGNQKKRFIEVKGVNLENDGVLYFPDAPSKRALKHIYELIDAVNAGYEGMILFVIQMDQADLFKPNDVTMPEFHEALIKAKEAGIEISGYTCKITPGSIQLKDPVEVRL